jgi:hypothetical protein
VFGLDDGRLVQVEASCVGWGVESGVEAGGCAAYVLLSARVVTLVGMWLWVVYVREVS